jgi:hypothetical protein
LFGGGAEVLKTTSSKSQNAEYEVKQLREQVKSLKAMQDQNKQLKDKLAVVRFIIYYLLLKPSCVCGVVVCAMVRVSLTNRLLRWVLLPWCRFKRSTPT